MNRLVLLLFAMVAVALAHKPKRQQQADDNIDWVTAYQGEELSDAFSAIRYLGDGIVVAGKRSSTVGNRVFRSTEYGVPGSWYSVGEITGYTGAHTYWFGSHDGVVVSGTGDTGNTCIIRSADWGETWAVVVDSAGIKTLAGGVDPQSVYSPIHMGNGRWICCLRSSRAGKHIIESLDDGATWHQFASTGLTAGARKMVLTKDGSVLYGGAFNDVGETTGVFVSSDGGSTWIKRLGGESIFSGLDDCGNGIYLAGTYAQGKSAISTATRARTSNVATVTTRSAHGLTTGSTVAIYTMGDSSFDVRPNTTVTVLSTTSFSYPCPGPNVATTTDTNGRVNFPVNQKIFRSTDYGDSWTQVATTTVYSSLTYIRSIQCLSGGVVYAYACASENSWSDRGLQYYKSYDYGLTWEWLPNQYTTGLYGQLNAIYEVSIIENKTIVAATQPDSVILDGTNLM
ncbi:hypothetical protein Pelo_2578 [Pelomyxa schiedti]|nr:hypothetical protein Pelo_2578 [Pelomyxa schiedti]